MKASTTTSGATRPRTRERAKHIVVALAVRDEALAAALAQRLKAARDAIALVCASPDVPELLTWLDAIRADVVLLDERWLQRLGAGVLPSLRERRPDRRVLLVGDRESAALAEHVVRNRFHGFLLAAAAVSACVKAVRAVTRGEMWMPRALLVQLLLERVDAAGRKPLEIVGDPKLTRREVEVVGYVRRGLANKQIADALAVREDTVKKHLRNAYAKLGIHRRSEIMTGARLVSG
jgi:DNA-binding NarL/FixJ family response regulator